MRSRLKALLVGAAWADHHRTPPGPPLRITDVAPDGGSTGVSTSPTIIVDFDKDMNSNTVFENIKLKKVGARRAMTLGGTYTFATATYDVVPNLKPNTTYKVIVDGGLDGVRSLDGGKLGGVDDSSARFRDGNVVWTFRTAP